MSSETLPGASGRIDAAGADGIVVVAHGGSARSTRPTTRVQLSVLRMSPVADAINAAVRGSGVDVRRARFRVRGWNGADASPVRDLTDMLDQISSAAGPRGVPVVLAGPARACDRRPHLQSGGHLGIRGARAVRRPGRGDRDTPW